MRMGSASRRAAERIWDYDAKRRSEGVRELHSVKVDFAAAIIEQEMDTETAEILAALKDAIRRPLGVVPASAERFLEESDE